MHKDIANLKAAASAAGYDEAFMNAASPGVVALFQPNQFYATDAQYIEALANAMATEFETIVNAGLLLQVDSPDLALGRHGAWLRTETRGTHARSDFPARDDSKWLKHSLCWVDTDGKARIDYRPVQLEPLTDEVAAVPPVARSY